MLRNQHPKTAKLSDHLSHFKLSLFFTLSAAVLQRSDRHTACSYCYFSDANGSGVRSNSCAILS